MLKNTAIGLVALSLSIGLAGCGDGAKDNKAGGAAPAGDKKMAPAGGGEKASEKASASAGEVKLDPATAGSIKGKVTYKGMPKPAVIDMAAKDKKCAEGHKAPVNEPWFVGGDGNALANVIVSVKSGPAAQVKTPAPTNPIILDQVGCEYVPHVFACRVDQPIEVRNSDPTAHNVQFRGKVSTAFNEQMAAGAAALKKSIGAQEAVKFNCEIHPWMNAYAMAFKHDAFKVTGKDGMYELKDLPPGDYVIEARHERFDSKPMTKKVKVDAKGMVENINFEFEFKDE